MSTSTDVVIVDVVGRVATVTLNRPEARNALSRELAAAFPKALTACENDDDVDVVILTGADPAFCAGFDLRELAGREAGAAPGAAPAYRAAIPPHTKPVIGAINGAAVTGGFEIALACDFLIASDRARFADTHAKVGLLPGWGLTVMLPEAIGARRAKQLSATGAFLDAPTALAWGLVNEVVEHDRLLPRCREIAAQIAANPAAAVRRVTGLYDEVADMVPPDGWVHESRQAREWIARRFDAGRATEVLGEARRKAP